MKTIRILLTGVVILLSGNLVQAAYLEFVPQQLTQPDGSTVACFASGDEYYHWLHDSDRYTIVLDENTGYFVYADRQGDRLVPTSLRPGRDNPAANGLTPGLNITPDAYRQRFNSRFKEPTLKSLRSFTTTGDYNNLVIFIRFSDQNEYTESLNVYSSQFNASNTVSMKEYYKEVSKSQLDITSTFYPLPAGSVIVSYQDSHPRRYYRPYSGSNPEGYRTDGQYIDREMTLLKNAALFVKAQVEASGVDYDHDHDGYVDNVCYIIQGRTDGWSDLLWPHRWVLYDGYEVYFNGARVYDFNFQLSEALGVSVLCHEMFHSLGAPDLYRYENDDITPVGPWDLMAYNQTPPQHMSAYMKMKYGKWFTEIPTITSDGTYSLQPLSTDGFAAFKMASPNSSTEFFVLEYRKAVGRFESSLVGSGLIIYRVNPSLDGNADGPPDEVYVYRPNGTTRYNGTLNSAPFSADMGRTAFNDDTNPSCFLSNGADGGISLSNIGSAGSTISFTVGSGSSFNPPRNLTASLTGRDITLSWEKPVAWNGTLDSYMVYRNQALISSITNPDILTYTDSNLTDGIHKYHVTAHYQTPTGESSPSNSVSVTVGGADRPDLVVTNPVVQPGNVEPGGLVNVFCTMVNRGAAVAGVSNLKIYLSLDEHFDAGDRQLATTPIGVLEAGSSIDIEGYDIEVPESTTNGKWFALFIADADGAVAESIEDNNMSSTLLVVGNPALNPPRHLKARVEQTTVILAWQEPEPGGGTLAGFAMYRNASKIATVTNPAQLEFTDPSLELVIYAYYVTAIYSSPVGESAKSNEVTVTVTNETKPDLTIQDFSVTPAVVWPGGSVDLSCNLLNIGGSQAPANQVEVYLSKDLVIDANDIYLAYGTIDPIEAGSQTAVAGSDVTLPDEVASGTWYALILADATHEIDESNEENNQASAILIVQGNTPDLQIVDVSFYPPVITPGTNVRVSSLVYNAGNALASSVKLSLFLSFDEILDDGDKKLFDVSTRSLGPKGTLQMSDAFVIQSDVLPGQYFLIAMVDKDNTINESDETNNQAVKAVVVSSATGIDGFSNIQDLWVYPVPASETLNLRLPHPSGEPLMIRFYDPLGRLVYDQHWGKVFPEWVQIDINNYKPGIYSLICIQGQERWTRQVVVE